MMLHKTKMLHQILEAVETVQRRITTMSESLQAEIGQLTTDVSSLTTITAQIQAGVQTALAELDALTRAQPDIAPQLTALESALSGLQTAAAQLPQAPPPAP